MATDTNEKQGQNAETEEPATSFLPQALGNLFDKECLQQDENRSAQLTLLTQGIKTETAILKDWETPLKWSLEGCSEEAQHEGKCWLEREQNRLGKEKVDLQNQLAQKKADIDAQQEKIASLEQEIQALIAELKALPDAVKTAKDRVTELEEALQTASPTRKELLEVELAAAIARRDQICDPAYEEKLNTAIQETLDSWRTERDKLRELSATDSDSSESVTILIAQIGKTLDYIDKYADLLIARYIRAKGLCEETPEPSSDAAGESNAA